MTSEWRRKQSAANRSPPLVPCIPCSEVIYRDLMFSSAIRSSLRHHKAAEIRQSGEQIPCAQNRVFLLPEQGGTQTGSAKLDVEIREANTYRAYLARCCSDQTKPLNG